MSLTSNLDNTSTEPELEDGDTNANTDPTGELANRVRFIWWADDGDNVLENCNEQTPGCVPERPINMGPLGNLGVGATTTVALADSNFNIWANATGTPFEGGDTRFIGKAWCFGNGNFGSWPQDGGNRGSGPDQRPITCDGSNENNITQTDSMTVDIAFRAVQSRNNPGFTCSAR